VRLLLPLSVTLACCLAGCDKPPAPKSVREPEPKTTGLAGVVPDVPEEETTGAAMKTVIKNPHESRTIKQDAYRTDGRTPSGRLVGACKWASPVVRRGGVPRPGLLDLGKAYAIKNAEKGEPEYYRNLGLRERWYFVNNYLGTYPTGVVLMVRGIKRGRRAVVDRPTFVIREGRLRPHMQFAPVGEPVMFGTYDSYPTHLRMESLASGKVALEDVVTAFDRQTIKPLGGGGVHYTARPKMLQSDVITELGPYEIRGTRHRWKKAYVVFIDNPYALIANRGRFALDLPVGTWDIDVWHPEFQTVQETHQVVIRRDETTELAVHLRPPDCLKPKAPGRPGR